MEINKQSLIAALFNFRQELKDFNIPQDKMINFMQKFKDAYERSGDYDLALSEVFDDVMRYVNRYQQPYSKSYFRSFWTSKNGGRKRTVHFSDLDKDTYLSILDQLREAIREGNKQGKTEEEIASEFAREYNLFFNDVFNWVWNRMNTKADLFGTYDEPITKQQEDELVHQAKSIISREQKRGQLLTDIIGAVALGLGVSYAMALKIAQKAKPNFGEEYFGNRSIQLG